MHLIAVKCSRPTDETDDEPRIGVVIADSAAEAEQLCTATYAGEGFNRFVAKTVIEEVFGGPARVLGFTGQQGAFGWN